MAHGVSFTSAAAFAAIACVSCRGCDAPPPPPAQVSRDAAVADAAVVELAARPLGQPDLAGFGWRKRGGQPAFRLARKAEAREDWPAVVTACQQALAADPGHLEADWLIAVGFAKLGKLDQVLAPLQEAAAGDFSKWGQASLEQPAMQAFLATPTGEAWRRRVEQDRERFAQAVAHVVIVTAGGDLYAVATGEPRWYRLTRASGAVVAALAAPAARKIAYVARVPHGLGVGLIDLARGSSSRPVPLGQAGPLVVAYSDKPPIGFWIGSGGGRATAWRQLDDDYHFHPLPHAQRPAGAWLAVGAKGSARLHALPPNVVADWDEQSLASAIRIGSSNRVVSVASPGLIDGNTATWSPDRVHIAFAAQLDDHCAPGAINTAAVIADASTGGTREIERAAGGIALQWLADRTLAVAGDHGVTIYNLDDAAPPAAIEGATGLLTPRERPRCAPVEPAGGGGEQTEPAEPDMPSDDAGDPR